MRPEVIHIHDCLDGTVIKELLLDREMCGGFVAHLGELGELRHFTEYKRPFFRVERTGAFVLKGTQGNRRVRAVFNMKGLNENLALVVARINAWQR
ncbi:MAG: hypothetical protein CME06_10385 [Gemmatimonadetes bacterium]|nr:hypothetical protein [Gemmatimonadota bacterium]